MMQCRTILLRVFAAILLLIAYSANAHEIKPSIVNINYAVDGDEQKKPLTIDIVVNLESLIAEIGPDHEDTNTSENSNYYKTLRALNERELFLEFDRFKSKFLSQIYVSNTQGNKIQLQIESVSIPPVGDINIPRDTRLRLSPSDSHNLEALRWRWHEAYGEVIVRANSDAIELDYAALLSPGQPSDIIQFTQHSRRSAWGVLGNYIVVGFEHILPKGLDHIVFVIGVFLLTPAWRSIAVQVTLFTIAHSITLALSINGMISVSAAIVEPLIALSILLVCIENYFSDRLSKWRIATVFMFGLLHGLGFASVLNEVGLDTQHFVIALLGFNIGVELGQLLIIAICMLGIGIWFGKHELYRNRFSIPASVIVGLIGLFWFIQRVS